MKRRPIRALCFMTIFVIGLFAIKRVDSVKDLNNINYDNPYMGGRESLELPETNIYFGSREEY